LVREDSMKNYDILFKQITEKIANTDFSGYTIQYPPLFSWEVADSADLTEEILKAWKSLLIKRQPYLGLYIHLPFCKQRCSYCRYFALKLERQSDLGDYLSALKKEIQVYRKIFYKSPIRSLYFGGGTPSLLNIRQLDDLFSYLYKNFNLSQCQQITFEGNPDFLDFKKLKLLKQWGVNRLTIGVQSLDSKVIKAVNRYQSQDSFLKCFQSARKAKIENINIDLMVGLPLQTINSTLQTLKTVIKLQPEMIHVHPFYPTALSEFIRKGWRLSKKDMRRREVMSWLSQELIQKAKYQPIKFDADGKNEAARNIQLSDAIEYNAPFLGIGAGAVSHITNYFRYVNAIDIKKYIANLDKNKLPIFLGCRLSKRDEMIYFITACLRYGQVDKLQFKKMFNQDLNKIFQKEIKFLERKGKIKNTDRYLYSKMENLGEYAIYSKYFYDKNLIEKCKKMFPKFKNKLKEEEIIYLKI